MGLPAPICLGRQIDHVATRELWEEMPKWNKWTQANREKQIERARPKRLSAGQWQKAKKLDHQMGFFHFVPTIRLICLRRRKHQLAAMGCPVPIFTNGLRQLSAAALLNPF
jgi:hypothetical protein